MNFWPFMCYPFSKSLKRLKWNNMKILTCHPNYLCAFGGRLLEGCIILLPPLTRTRTWCSEFKGALNTVSQNKIRPQPATRYISFCRAKHFTMHYCATKCFVYRKSKQLFVDVLLFCFYPTNGMEVQTQVLVQAELKGFVCKNHTTSYQFFLSDRLCFLSGESKFYAFVHSMHYNGWR